MCACPYKLSERERVCLYCRLFLDLPFGGIKSNGVRRYILHRTTQKNLLFSFTGIIRLAYSIFHRLFFQCL